MSEFEFGCSSGNLGCSLFDLLWRDRLSQIEIGLGLSQFCLNLGCFFGAITIFRLIEIGLGLSHFGLGLSYFFRSGAIFCLTQICLCLLDIGLRLGKSSLNFRIFHLSDFLPFNHAISLLHVKAGNPSGCFRTQVRRLEGDDITASGNSIGQILRLSYCSIAG